MSVGFSMIANTSVTALWTTPATTISTIGMGPANPVADNSTTTGRQQNRRVEVVVTVDESKTPKQ